MRFPKIELTAAQLEWCLEHGLAIWKAKGEQRGRSARSDNFIVGADPWFRDQVSAIAEKGWEIFSGEKMNTEVWAGARGDGGSDFKDGNDIKGAAQENKPNLMIPKENYEREDLKVEKYTLIWVCKPALTICKILGECSRQEFEDRKRFWEKGLLPGIFCDTYFFDARWLHPVKRPGTGEQMDLF